MEPLGRQLPSLPPPVSHDRLMFTAFGGRARNRTALSFSLVQIGKVVLVTRIFSVLLVGLTGPMASAVASVNCAKFFTSSVMSDKPAGFEHVDNALSVIAEIPRAQSYTNNPLSIVDLDQQSQFAAAVPPWTTQQRDTMAVHFRDYFAREVFNNPAKASYGSPAELLYSLITASHGWATGNEHRNTFVIGSLHAKRSEALSNQFYAHTLRGRNIAYLRERDTLIANGDLDIFDVESDRIQLPQFIFIPVESSRVTEFLLDTRKEELLSEGGTLKMVAIGSSFPGAETSFVFSDLNGPSQSLTVAPLADATLWSTSFREALSLSRPNDERVKQGELNYRARIDSQSTSVPIYYKDGAGVASIVGRLAVRERTLTRLLLGGNSSTSWNEVSAEFSDADLKNRSVNQTDMRAWVSQLLSLLPSVTKVGTESQLILLKIKEVDGTVYADFD